MMRVVSRGTSGREVIDSSFRGGVNHHKGLNYLLGNSLQHSLREFKEHHRACSTRRRAAAAFEASVESQRTDFLARKYMDTVRQDQGTTACVGLASSNHSTQTSNTSMNSTAQQHQKLEDRKDTAGTSNEMIHHSISNPISNPISPKTEVLSPEHKINPVISDIKGACSSSLTITSKNSDVMVKSEPHNSGRFSSCSKQSVSSNSCQETTGQSRVNVGGNLSRSSSGTVKPRTRRSSKDLIIRSLCLSQTSSTSCCPGDDDDSENDLILTADDIFNGKIGRTPLKPLEEVEETVTITNTVKHTSITSNSSGRSTVTPPVNSTPLTSNPVQLQSATLRKELDAFSKVMNEVERAEKAKERRASLPLTASYSLQMGGSNTHLISPPSYSISGLYPTTDQQQIPNHYPQVQSHFNTHVYRQMDSFGIQGNGNTFFGSSPRLSPTDPISQQSPHLTLQHPPTTSCSQISALLTSPVSSSVNYDSISHTYPPVAPTQSPHNASLIYSHNTPYGSTVPWRTQAQSLGNPVGPIMAGQKRHSISTPYAPPTKISHSIIPHATNTTQLINESLPHYHQVAGSPSLHVPPPPISYTHSNAFSHMS